MSLSSSSSWGSKATFHFQEDHHRLSNGEAATDLMVELADAVVLPAFLPVSGASVFSDWAFYQELKQLGCLHVELNQVHVEYSPWFLTGIQVTYKCTFATGFTSLHMAPRHDFQRFRYGHYHSKALRSTLVLGDEEFLVNIATRRVDKITDRITLKTNRRTVSFGSPDCSGFLQKWLLPHHNDNGKEESTADDDDHDIPVAVVPRKVVALGGIASTMSEELGCFSESQNWRRLKHWILIRRLVDQNRAFVPEGGFSKHDQVMQALVADVNDDVFPRILSFLVPKIN
jgi:hypothetical protein